ncbi:TraB/GumN family protein [Pseudoxanthomonas sp. LH2527]|uniref:TraB/GumN family protein n=1 Tax=Pseudoxanthomonas sp. LH2527 TaxID=2923249 RepID=UPI001F12D68B|nr:TraB/GumN family protein [Pseudoxanthomonas sp. LH2527]MCH6483756.1 TraB/GumN family protein [Pseudoxanthomonas sp. LH2527]
MPLRRSLKVLVLTALLGSASNLVAETPKAAAAPVPLLWKVSDKDNAVYLLGSFHLLRPSDYPLSRDVDNAFADAERLMFELSPEEMQSPAMPQLMMQAAMRTDGKTLQDELDAGTWTRLQAWAGRNGVPLASFNGFEPWFVGLTISIVEMTRQGLDPKLGLDTHLMDKAQAAGKPTAGLERAQEQIGVLDGMDATEQRQFITEALEQAEKGSAETQRLHDAWRRGDVEALWNGMAADMRTQYPRLYRRINVDRNNAWVPKIRQILDRPGDDDALVVVGALHLLGEDGVVEKLRARGYTVERVCSACKAGAAR